MWKGDAKENAKPVPHWFHFSLQAIAAAFVLYWYKNVPLPNKAILLLAAVAALMLLADVRPIHKAIYVILILALVGTENRAINNDRKQFVDDQKATAVQQKEGFQQIGDGINKNIQESEQQFQAMMSTTNELLEQNRELSRTSQQSIEDITGGSSFCYVMALYELEQNGVSLGIYTQGNSPLHDVEIQKADLDKAKEVLPAPPGTFIPYSEDSTRRMASIITPYPSVPFLSSNSIRALDHLSLVGINARNLEFYFVSMNGNWEEKLSLRKVNGKWTQAIKVTKISARKHLTKEPKERTLFRYVAPDFPKTEPSWSD
jgi:hypothetical protein